MRKRAVGMTMLAALASGPTVVVGTTTTRASAATATVGNGLTTTDLNAVGMSPTSLAQALVGPGVTVSNVTFTGDKAQAGTIHLVDPAVVSFNDGVILSSGNIADVVGPNKSDSTTGDMVGAADADLNALIANSQTVLPITFDAASLEFDFVPSASPVYFTYTFGSDEYLEWVNLFNDVFAFFVNGQNCATVPGGPVSIDTINDTVNPSLFRDNSFALPPANPINIESDGLSVELICTAPVNVGKTNHMKLAIADTSDQILDSVVMIKSHSLSTIKPESCNDSVDNDDDSLIDMDDDSCMSSTTQAPTGLSGIGSSGNAPAFTGYEGWPGILLDASTLDWIATSDTLTTSWTVTGINGTPGTCEVIPSSRLAVGPNHTIAPVMAVCPNEGEYTARVDGWDIEGKSAFDKDVDFFVHNAPPAVAIDQPTLGSEYPLGDTVTMSAYVADPGLDDAVSCTIDWGDGDSSPGIFFASQCTGTHTYTEMGPVLIAVTAADGAGDAAAGAVFVTIAGPPATVPDAVTGLSASAGASKVLLSWIAPNDGGAPITGYDVRVSTSASMSPAATLFGATSGATSTTVSNVIPGTTYWFQVRAVNSVGTASWGPTNAVSATPFAVPSPPSAPTAVRDDFGAAKLTAATPKSDGGSPIISYTFKSSPGAFTCTAIAPATSCVIKGLTGGVAYTFTVSAKNAAGSSSPSAASMTLVAISRTAFSTSATSVTTSAPGTAATLDLVPNSAAAVPVNARLMMYFTTDSVSTTSPAVSSIAFPSGGAGTCTTSYTTLVGATTSAGSGIRGGILTCRVTSSIPKSGKVRITLSSAPMQVVAFGEYFIGFASGGTVSTRALAVGAASTPASSATTTLSANTLVIGAFSYENGSLPLGTDTDTAGGSSWRGASTLANGVSGTGGLSVTRNYKFNAISAAQMFNTTTATGAGQDWIGAILSIQ